MSNVKFKLMVNTVVTGSHQQLVYKPVAVRRGLITLDFIAGMIADKSSQSRSDLIAAAVAFAHELHYWLSEGYAVDLGPLGRFEVILRSRKMITNAEEPCNEDVKFGRIFYRPEVTIMRSLQQLSLERDRSAEMLVPLEEEELRKQVLLLMKTRPSITASIVMRELHMRYERAQELLRGLAAEGTLKMIELMSGDHYVMAKR